MKKIWLVARSTYLQRVRTGSFLTLTFALPVLMLIAGAVPIFMASNTPAPPAIGVVDETERLDSFTPRFPADESLSIRTYADQATAQAALQRGEIGGYLVLPVDYFAGAPPILYATTQVVEEFGEQLDDELRRALRAALLSDRAPWPDGRLAEPTDFTYVDSRSGQSLESGPGLVIRILLPIAMAILFGLVVFTSVGQMGAAMVSEKDQRAMEIIITSITPRELVMGKILGLTLLSLTQISIWLLGAVLAMALASIGRFELQAVSIPWQVIGWMAVLAVPTYFLYAVLATGLGIIAGDSQQAQQLASMLGFVGLVPLWLAGVLVANPNGPLAVALTLFPLTSPMVSPIRMTLATAPPWQLGLALAIILVSLLLSIWFVVRIFRAAMLLYGQSLRPRAVWEALRAT